MLFNKISKMAMAKKKHLKIEKKEEKKKKKQETVINNQCNSSI